MNNETTTPKSFFAALGGGIERILIKKQFTSCLFSALIMNLLAYFLNTRSFIGGIQNIFDTFGFFLFNLLILTAFYSISLFFNRRIFVMTLVTVVWLALGVTNFVLRGMRDNALEAIDFQIIRTGLGIVTIYLSIFELVLYIGLVLAAIGLLVLLFIKCPKIRPKYSYALLILICCLLMLSLVGFAIIKPSVERDEMTADNVGFPYFFLCSVFDRGIDRPNGYSENTVEEILNNLSEKPSTSNPQTPNVIFVQLESFFDVNRIEEVEFSENPIPNFTALSKSNGSGLFTVKSIGSGTANTEFEVLSGLDLEFFGVGEYPYTSVLGDLCCETIAYDLAELGYSSHAMHNHTATFYDRYKVYANLGFDCFTPLEHMKNVEYNSIGWEKDKILTEYIFKSLNSAKERDFVFAVSVQGHGKYPDIPIDENPKIRVSGIEDKRVSELEYYVNQLYEMDLFIGELYNAVMNYDEDTVLVFYGDHLPALEIAADELENKNLYQTDYVILSNFGFYTEDRDISAYELFPLILNNLGIDNGFINKAHAAYREDPNFGEILRTLGYDMLYGNQIAYPEGYPYTPTDMVLGIDEICVTGIEQAENGFYVYGENFTPFSNIFTDSGKVETEFIDENTLFAANKSLEYGDAVSVVQISTDFRKLSQTDIYVHTRGFLD